MQIFVKKPQGSTTTLNVESNETIFTIKRKLKEKEGIRSDLHLELIYDGTLLEDGHTLAHYDILKESTLRLFLSQDALADVFTLRVKHEDSIDDVKAKIQEEKGIPSHKQLLFHLGKWLEDGSHTLADYRISNIGVLDLAIRHEEAASQPNVTSQEDPRQTKRARPATPTKATSIFDTGDGEATAALSDLMPESQACPPSSVLIDLEDVKHELDAIISRLKAGNKKTEEELMLARSKEKGLDATISRLKVENKKNKKELTLARSKEKGLDATISRLKARNKKTEKELMLARKKEKELEATISGLKAENKKNEEISRNKEKELETTISGLKAENKKTEKELTIVRNKEKKLEASISNKKNEEELTIARNKEKELEATISALAHKNKVFSDQCASYESLVDDLEVENKKTREEYYAGARAAGYAEGLKEGKAKRLTDTSMRCFNHGFDSCQKQAEEQGFCGQVNKKNENKKNEEELMINARNREMALEAAISRLKAENKKNEEELMINARNREMALEAVISRLKAKNKKNEEELMINARNREMALEAAISRLKAENKKNEEELMINARNREMVLEAAISRLKAENKKNEEELMINARNREIALEAAISRLKAENKKNEEELMINARNREMVLEAAISGLKAANKKKEEELMINARNREMVLEAAISRLKAENKKKEEELMINARKIAI